MLRKIVTRAPQVRAFTTSAPALKAHWDKIEPIGLDAIKQLTLQFQEDQNPNKILLGEGVYRDDNGKPVIMKSVREAEKILYEKGLDHEYAAVTGVASFCEGARRFAFGENSSAIKEGRIASVQTLSGTGSLRLAAAFLNKFAAKDALVFMPDPTWGNHHNIFNDAGWAGRVKKYAYFDPKTSGLDEKGFLSSIENMPKGSVILLHACAHNPTGVDPKQEVWKKVSKLCKERELIVYFDSAYQAFATGDAEADAWAYRQFVEDGHHILVSQSFAKNFGLYGERAGALHVVTGSKKEAANVTSQLAVIIRAMYSNPPLYGARLVSTVLNDPKLLTQWRADVKEMADRIRSCREQLVKELVDLGSKRNWSHITDQIGMFAFTGLTAEQVEKLIKDQHIYMTKDGRLSISGLNSKNIKTVAKAIHEVTK